MGTIRPAGPWKEECDKVLDEKTSTVSSSSKHISDDDLWKVAQHIVKQLTPSEKKIRDLIYGVGSTLLSEARAAEGLREQMSVEKQCSEELRQILKDCANHMRNQGTYHHLTMSLRKWIEDGERYYF